MRLSISLVCLKHVIPIDRFRKTKRSPKDYPPFLPLECISDRDVGESTDVKKRWETILKRCAPKPPIEPKVGFTPILHVVFGAQLKIPLDLLESRPEL
jgi:hypothetical protein